MTDEEKILVDDAARYLLKKAEGYRGGGKNPKKAKAYEMAAKIIFASLYGALPNCEVNSED